MKRKGSALSTDNSNRIRIYRLMARPSRIEYPGGYYHVMNRGNRREDIFLTDNDRKVFLNTLTDRKTKSKDLRQMAMELSYRYSNCKQKEIGAIFGVDYSTVSQSRRRLKTKIKSHRKLNKQFRQILEQIENLSISKI
jgi:DNA-directed RNA polymerase specialized sigma subunit